MKQAEGNLSHLFYQSTFSKLVPENFPVALIDVESVALLVRKKTQSVDSNKIADFVDKIHAKYMDKNGHHF